MFIVVLYDVGVIYICILNNRLFEKYCQYTHKTKSIMNDIKIKMNLINTVPIDFKDGWQYSVVTQLFKLIQKLFFVGICRMLRCMALPTAPGPSKASFLRSCLNALNKYRPQRFKSGKKGDCKQLKYPYGRDNPV